MQTFQGDFSNIADLNVLIVTSRFNNRITDSLLEGALGAFKQYGVQEKNIIQSFVPGALELPIAVQKLATKFQPDVCVAIGCVLKGATDHYEHVSCQSISGVSQVSLKLDIPVINCILTTATLEQAMERTGIRLGNKGYEAAVAACEMGSLFKKAL